MAAFKIL